MLMVIVLVIVIILMTATSHRRTDCAVAQTTRIHHALFFVCFVLSCVNVFGFVFFMRLWMNNETRKSIERGK